MTTPPFRPPQGRPRRRRACTAANPDIRHPTSDNRPWESDMRFSIPGPYAFTGRDDDWPAPLAAVAAVTP